LLASLGLETDGGLPPAEEVLSAIRMDKKYRGGARFVLLEDVGRPFVEDAVPQELLRAALDQSGSGAQAMGG
jgi:3-dehydroquinate synthetase